MHDRRIDTDIAVLLAADLIMLCNNNNTPAHFLPDNLQAANF